MRWLWMCVCQCGRWLRARESLASWRIAEARGDLEAMKRHQRRYEDLMWGDDD